jgi:hypothetical protein
VGVARSDGPIDGIAAAPLFGSKANNQHARVGRRRPRRAHPQRVRRPRLDFRPAFDMTVASTSTQPPPTNGSHNEDDEFLDSVEGEITFFRSIMRARPVGIHRYFHILAIRNAILQDTGRSVTIESLWKKLRAYYNLDALEVAVSPTPNSTVLNLAS